MNKYNENNMKKSILKKLNKDQLIELLLANQKPNPKPRERSQPIPRKTLKQMVKENEQNIIEPPPEFRDGYKPTPKPRILSKRFVPVPRPLMEFHELKPVPKPRVKSLRPVPAPRNINLDQKIKLLKYKDKN